jgi:hypothetical protein
MELDTREELEDVLNDYVHELEAKQKQVG